MPDLTFPLQTERLDLRPFGEGDLDDVRELYGDAQVHRYLYSEAMDDQALREHLEKKMSYRVLDKEGDGLALLAVLRETGQAVGDAVLIWVSQEHQMGEIGYVLKPDQRGHGYATEMAAAVMQLGFETLGLHRVIGRLDARNTASAGVLERLGMRHEALLVENEWVKGEWASESVYALLAAEWSAARSAVDNGGTTSAPPS